MSFQARRMLQLATTPASETPQANPLLTQSHLPDKALIRAAYATMRQSFHELLDTLDDRDLQQSHFATSPYSVDGLLTHCLLAAAAIPQEVECIRQGRTFYRRPRWLFKLLRIARTQVAARRESCASLAHKFDLAVTAALAALESIQADEWQQGVCGYAEHFRTIEWVLAQPPQHLREHLITIRQILAQRARPAKAIAAHLF